MSDDKTPEPVAEAGGVSVSVSVKETIIRLLWEKQFEGSLWAGKFHLIRRDSLEADYGSLADKILSAVSRHENAPAVARIAPATSAPAGDGEAEKRALASNLDLVASDNHRELGIAWLKETAREAAATLRRAQPPQPTGDVLTDTEREHLRWLKVAGVGSATTTAELLAIIDRLNSRLQASESVRGILSSNLRDCTEQLSAAEARVAELEKALEPFADAAKQIPDDIPDDLWTHCKTYDMHFTDEQMADFKARDIPLLNNKHSLILWIDGTPVKDFRRARAALSSTEPAGRN